MLGWDLAMMCMSGRFTKAGNRVSSSVNLAFLQNRVPRLVFCLSIFHLKGLYPWYLIFFVQSAITISGSVEIYRCQQASQVALLKKAASSIELLFYTVLVLNYSAAGFMLCYYP